MPRSAIIRSVRPRPGATICAEWPDHVYQWHREGFELPSGGELLAEGDAFSVQAFRYGTGYALQFHPEVTHAMMYRWLVRGAHRMEMPGTKQRSRAHRRSRGARFCLAQLAGRLSRSLDRAAKQATNSRQKPVFALRSFGGQPSHSVARQPKAPEGAKAGGAEGI